MDFNLAVVIPPTTEIITLAQAKNHCRVEIDDDDDLITDLITTSRRKCENYVRRTFNPTGYELRLSRFPWSNCSQDWDYGNLASYHRNRFYIPKPPLISIDAITYLDANGVLQTLHPSLYSVDAGGEGQGSILMSSLPPIQILPGLDSVRIAFTAGYDTSNPLPSEARSSTKLLVGHYYRNRTADEIPQGIRSILSPMLWGSYA